MIVMSIPFLSTQTCPSCFHRSPGLAGFIELSSPAPYGFAQLSYPRLHTRLPSYALATHIWAFLVGILLRPVSVPAHLAVFLLFFPALHRPIIQNCISPQSLYFHAHVSFFKWPQNLHYNFPSEASCWSRPVYSSQPKPKCPPALSESFVKLFFVPAVRPSGVDSQGEQIRGRRGRPAVIPALKRLCQKDCVFQARLQHFVVKNKKETRKLRKTHGASLLTRPSHHRTEPVRWTFSSLLKAWT